MKIRENIKTAIFYAVFPCALCGMLKLRHVIIPEWGKYIVGIFALIALLSLFCPKFGDFIHKKASEIGGAIGHLLARIILFFVFIFTVIPTGLLMKIVKRDRLRLKKQDLKTYWINNEQKTTDYEYQF